MLVYPYRKNAATTDLPVAAVVPHRNGSVPVYDAPDGVWQLLLTEGWLVWTGDRPVRDILETVITDEAHSHQPPAPATNEQPTATPLPFDFPARLTWIRAGIETIEAFDTLTREQALLLPHIGEARYEQAMLHLMQPVDWFGDDGA